MSESKGSDAAPRRRSRFQLRLSTLLVLSVAIGLWLGLSARQVRIERQTAERIEAMGGRLTYREVTTQPGWTDALARLWPGGHGEQVIMISLSGREFDDAALALVARLRSVEVVHLIDCSVTDEGLARLRGLTRLRALVLSGSDGITDRGLDHLSGINSLAVVDLNGTSTTEAGRRRLETQISGLQVD